jgi:hypothetical protein
MTAPYQRQKNIPAFHCMEYSQGILVNDIVQDFKRVAVPVKADKQVAGVQVILPITVTSRSSYKVLSKAQ